MPTKPLTIALNRGRILDEFLPLLAGLGIRSREPIKDSRKLVFDSEDGSVRLVVMRGSDVPTYVEYGAADLGVTGKDTLLEHGGAGFYERLDLGIARCRIMTAAPIDAPEVPGVLRVATKFVNIAKRYFAERGRQAEIIRLSGAVEIAPLMGLADCIVDIVDTGSTLHANGLRARDVVAEISTRVIVNRAALKTRFDAVETLLERLAQAVGQRGGR
jgi:ATP phosphoribosyltransferase